MNWTFFWITFCASLPLEMRVIWFVFLTNLVSFLCCPSPPCGYHRATHAHTACLLRRRHPQLAHTTSRSTAPPLHIVSPPSTGPPPSISYSREELLAVNPSAITSALTSRLRQLRIGVDLSRRVRGCRGGRRKQRKIPVVTPTSRPTPVPTKSKTVNFNNLISIPLAPPCSSDPMLLIAHFNPCSVGLSRKRSAINDFIYENNVDIFCVTESWLLPVGDEAKCVDLAPPGYRTLSFPRCSRGGGIAFVVRESLVPHLTTTSSFPFQHSSFELAHLSINLRQHRLHLFCLYRPPPNKKNKLSDNLFIEEFPSFLEHCNTIKGSPVIVGDFNIHVDVPTDPLTTRFTALLNDFGLHQAVTFPTHHKGHTLDLVISRRDEDLLMSTTPNYTLDFSDHYCVVSKLRLSRPSRPPVYVEARKIADIDTTAFMSDLRVRLEASTQLSADQLHHLLSSLLDCHAPATRRKVSCRPLSPWFASVGPELLQAKRERRQAERHWLKSGLEIHKQIFRAANNLVTNIVDKAKCSFYSAKILACTTSRQLFSITNSLLGKVKSTPLPSSIPMTELPQCFSDFFHCKIATIRQALDSCTVPPPAVPDPSFSGTRWAEFRSVSVDEVRNILKRTTVKTCELDPLPLPLLTSCLDDLLPYFTTIINDSLQSGCFPSQFKSAIVKPLLKKQNLDPDNLKNYRPVSNLSFLSKLIEKVVLVQLSDHLSENNLFCLNQSAYRACHSTETALLKIVNDLLTALDDNKVSLLSLLDLSAAFDTIDHSILLSRLNTSFGLSGNVLSWFSSYLSNRTQTVLVNGCKSPARELKFGVPQGSVLGPILFVLYTQPLSAIINHHSLIHHSFSDDNQLYVSAHLNQLQEIICSSQSCISDVKAWMHNNKLQLNADKTEMIFIASKHTLRTQSLPCSIDVDGHEIILSTSVRNLGVTLDPTLSFEHHISNVCKACYLELRRISSIRRFLTQDALKTLISAFVLSRLDYCNSLLVGCPLNLISKLQKVQNNAARLISGTSTSDHVTPVLRSLHWLPVHSRIDYKVLLLVYKSLHDLAPPYLSDLLQFYVPPRQLRSSADTRLLRIPSARLKTSGQRAFRYQAPTLWNSLPLSLRHSDSKATFRSSLKTHLFPRSN